MTEQLVIYGAQKCADTQRALDFLNRRAIPYSYVGVDRAPRAEQLVKEWNDGKRVTPTIVFGSDNRRLAAPSDEELERALRDHGLLPRSRRIQGHATSLRELRRAG